MEPRGAHDKLTVRRRGCARTRALQWHLAMTSVPNVTIDPFASWFAHSVVRDEQGAPLICYHAGREQIAAFKPFTHFGTLAAAQRRAKDKRIARPFLHEVYLAIAKPLDVHDDEADNNAQLLLDLAVYQGIITHDDRTQLLSGLGEAISAAISKPGTMTDHVARKWNAGMGHLAPKLVAMGYDGLRYENRQEGGVSFVNFASNQVWQSGKVQHD